MSPLPQTTPEPYCGAYVTEAVSALTTPKNEEVEVEPLIEVLNLVSNSVVIVATGKVKAICVGLPEEKYTGLAIEPAEVVKATALSA